MADAVDRAESPANSAERQPIGMKLVWVGIVGAGAVVFVVALIMAFGSGTGARIRALREQGEPTTLRDLKQQSATIPDQENAAIGLATAAADVAKVVAALAPVIDNRDYGGPLSDSDAALATKLFAENDDAIESIRQAIQLPNYGAQFDYEPSQSIRVMQDRAASTRSIARVLCLKSEVLAREGKADEAVQVGIDVLRLGRHIGHEPSAMSLLVSVAIRQTGADSVNDGLRAGDVSDATRTALRAEMANDDIGEAYLRAMRTERVVAIENARAQGGSFAMSFQLGQLFDSVEQQIAEVERGGLARNAAGTTKTAGPANPALDATRTAALRWLAASRCLQVVERLTATADQEAMLEDLELPAASKVDPFGNGLPLTIERDADGWAVFSAGPDGVYSAGKSDDVGLRKRQLTPSKE